ncbi:MAG: bifunctional (p)ppGpp synthetase/guanosine-3',5'-bis(diphosphate) 3'-pyrophosphohydrolase [Chitinispirillia bacterium]|nr:bifunctional (p)ppGpp synthetase/guanosine-3',5'-bis(diphosphate) 3'-pyrophosphohydrolase [Chitinispirillia bacterium]MCL2242466.1 bifunctional (p)ppGpp synthetase/guanosine-3',5'-bis(diphosphate) 3'-pyrophosphohydrolase [Chitinispirillia bacterium]
MESILNSLPASTPDAAVEQFLAKIQEINPGISTELVGKAFLFSWEAHKDQRRKSGEPYLAHPVSVAFILAEQKLDPVTIAAGLLHDVIEDTPTTKDDLAGMFGEDVALLVDGVTKIQALQMRTREERQAETYRKMLLSMAKDLRVIIIKFADRVHNLRTLKYLEPEKIKLIAKETLDVYSPLALRLGMAKIKCELDDLAFKHLYPDEYKDIVSKVVASRVDRESLIDTFSGPLRSYLEREGINATIAGRSKHFYSIYNKMQKSGKAFEEIYDVLAIRIIVDSIKDCYWVLGIVHSMWMPVQERFKDYISAPKNNGYRSLHTTVVGKQGSIVEMQIRTWEMNKTAEEGIAAHWLYKEGTAPAQFREGSTDDKAIAWLKNIIEWQENLTDSAEFYEFFKVDLFDAEIFVFTPKGNLHSMPKGATVLDFAFAVHTDIGIHCIGAKIDGHIEPVSAELKSGQTIEILHLNTKTPSADTMRYVKTPKARSAIRHWLNNAEKQESIDLGKKIVLRAYEKLHANSDFSDHAPELLQHLGLISVERLYEMVGRGDLTESRVMGYFQARKIKRNVMSQFMKNLTGQRPQGIRVGGKSNLMVRFAECCNPIPGDRIIGFLTKGRGISVHNTDCRNVGIFEDDRERRVEVSWDEGEQKKYLVALQITAADRSGLFRDISGVFVDFGASISNGTMKTGGGKADMAFQIEIRNLSQLKQILRQLEKIKGIEKIDRVKDYISYPEYPQDGTA